MDFPTFLVLAAAVTGGIWAFDAAVLAPRRRAAAAGASGEGAAAPRTPWLVDYARSFFPVIVVVLLIRSFVVEPFRIPSGSMMPTLLAGDFILVNKFAYGLRLPVLNVKVVPVGEPRRGDVVVFRYPRDPGTDYIKRVVGLPGDRIAYRDKVLYVNGRAMPQRYLGIYPGAGGRRHMAGAEVRLEDLEGVLHRILVRPEAPALDGEYVVPAGQYFVMGDNRDNSNDSRFWGTVPESYLVGKAFLVWMSWDPGGGGVQWSRIGLRIR